MMNLKIFHRKLYTIFVKGLTPLLLIGVTSTFAQNITVTDSTFETFYPVDNLSALGLRYYSRDAAYGDATSPYLRGNYTDSPAHISHYANNQPNNFYNLVSNLKISDPNVLINNALTTPADISYSYNFLNSKPYYGNYQYSGAGYYPARTINTNAKILVSSQPTDTATLPLYACQGGPTKKVMYEWNWGYINNIMANANILINYTENFFSNSPNCFGTGITGRFLGYVVPPQNVILHQLKYKQILTPIISSPDFKNVINFLDSSYRQLSGSALSRTRYFVGFTSEVNFVANEAAVLPFYHSSTSVSSGSNVVQITSNAPEFVTIPLSGSGQVFKAPNGRSYLYGTQYNPYYMYGQFADKTDDYYMYYFNLRWGGGSFRLQSQCANPGQNFVDSAIEQPLTTYLNQPFEPGSLTDCLITNLKRKSLYVGRMLASISSLPLSVFNLSTYRRTYSYIEPYNFWTTPKTSYRLVMNWLLQGAFVGQLTSDYINPLEANDLNRADPLSPAYSGYSTTGIDINVKNGVQGNYLTLKNTYLYTWAFYASQAKTSGPTFFPYNARSYFNRQSSFASYWRESNGGSPSVNGFTPNSLSLLNNYIINYPSTEGPGAGGGDGGGGGGGDLSGGM